MAEARITVGAVDNTRAAFDSVKSNLQGLHTSATAVLGALGAFGSIGMFASMIKGSIDSAAALNDLSIQTGATVEALSALGGIGKLSDVSTEQIGNAMNKLAKNMAGATEESKGTGKAIEALGINFDSFKKLNPEDQMQAVAKAMDDFADGSGKSAVAMALYGKEGAKMLPFLKDLAEVGDLQAKVTGEQAAMADNFADNLTKLQVSGESWKKEMAMGMLPALNLGVQAFIDVTNGSGGLRDEVRRLSADGSIAAWTKGAITGLTYVADAVQYVIRAVKAAGESIGAYAAAGVAYFGGIGAAIKQVLAGDFSGAVASMKTGMDSSRTIISSLGESLIATFGEDTIGSRIRARMAEIEATGTKAEAAKTGLDFTNVLEKNGKAAKDAKDPLDALLKTIAEHTDKYKAELKEGEKLTEGQKLYAKAMSDVANGTLQLDTVRKATLKTALDGMLVSERTSIVYLEEVKALHELAKENLKQVEAYEKTVDASADQNKALKEEVEMMALGTKGQLELTQARMAGIIITKQQELASIEAADAESGTMSRRQIALAEDIRLLQERSVLLGDKSAIEQNKTSFNSIWQSIDGTAHDVFTNIFQGGQNAFTKLRDTLKATLLDLLYQMTVKKWVFNITAAVTGTSSGLAQAATGQGGELAGLAGTASNLNSLFSMATGNSLTSSIGSLAGTVTGLTAANTALATSIGIDAASAAAASSAAAAAGGTATLTAGLSAIGPVGWAAIAAVAAFSIFGSNKGKPTASTGDSSISYGADGTQTSKLALSDYAYKAIETSAADAIVGGLQLSYARAAASLGIKTVATDFAYGANTGKGGESPNFVVGVNAGTSKYNSGEVGVSKEALALESSRVMLTALQGSELPKYLSGVFDGLVASSMTQDQITASLNGATALAAFHAQLLDMPFAQLADLSYAATQGLVAATGGLDGLKSGLASYYDNFYSESEKTANTTRQITEALAGVNVAMPKTRDEFKAQMNAAMALGDAGAPVVAALLNVNSAFASIVPAAQDAAAATANAAASMAQAAAQTRAQISGLAADYLNSADLRNFRAGEIQQTLAGGGVNLTVDQILNASRADALALYNSLDGNTAAQKAILDAGQAFAALTPAMLAAASESSSGGGGGGGGGVSPINTVLDKWTSATDAMVAAMKDLTGGLLDSGIDSVARLEAQFAIDVARAKSGDLAAAQDLPALAKSLVDASKSSSQTAVDQAVYTARIIESLGSVVESRTGIRVPQFAVGTNYVPQDMLAMIHQGEAIVPAAYNPANGGSTGSGSGADMQALQAQVARLEAALVTALARIESNTGKTHKVLDEAAGGARPLGTVAMT